ncbi:hypothetical protein EMIHUDRAFT_249337 [Emiliania huxleyi CCMP1516]|uniref:ATP-dependent RNA helicase n=2 Tax=Emiliania huxleyi TaxID=2903 RepID=A0A0D3I9B7_EMIH1|nr:hypothetical protein EMIHUDRAFT_249337 [Emiliania huxleyi CCMP1516]EOD07852.1 hypothetical protein EMIHUDRAFT_249337 [Emiliania huxleyi CCMP1516]|eukprot:XP_005760281.1 hypothetical protein EMIHUDRAFT_249337 [Emiliania huxleyi CCMP1516]
MVYFLTCACVAFYSATLPQLPALRGASFAALHGKMSPKPRRRAFDTFAQQQQGAVLLCTDVAARGLDLPDVDWDPNAYVHRVGRTARMGRSGAALLLLRPEEEAYVHFLAVRKAPVEPREPEPSAPPVAEALTRLAVADRAVMERGAAAYVSFLKAYQEHVCRYVFVFDKLDLGALASAMGLLRLPRVRELGKKRKRGKGSWVEFTPAAQVDLEADDFAREARLMKQLRRGKITQAQFNAAMGESDDGP